MKTETCALNYQFIRSNFLDILNVNNIFESIKTKLVVIRKSALLNTHDFTAIVSSVIARSRAGANGEGVGPETEGERRLGCFQTHGV